MRRLIKNWDLNGKPITFYYLTSSIHKTIFGGILSVVSFSLMLTITISTLINFLYQKPNINSNIVFYINKKFMYLENMDIKGSIRLDNNDEENQLDDFVKYFRVAFYEKNEYDSFDNIKIAKLIKDENEKSYKFGFKIPISDVFKDKDFSVLKIMSCKELRSYDFASWEDEDDYENCNKNYNEYFEKNYKKNDFSFSFDTPIYSIDRKGNLQKTYRENEFSFTVIKNNGALYSMETKFIVIEDNSSLVFSNKQYEANVILKNPKLLSNSQKVEGYSLSIELENTSGEQIILITIYKYKLLDVLATLGGIMKIITFMKMTCRFWSSYLYEKSLYNLVISRKNKYLEERRNMIESNYYNPNNLNRIGDNLTNPLNPSNVRVNQREHRNRPASTHYTSYCVWFANRFCKCFYLNKEAKQKRKMLCEILGLENYLLHLDYIDRLIMLEHHDNKVSSAINETNAVNNENSSHNSDERNNVIKDLTGALNENPTNNLIENEHHYQAIELNSEATSQ